MDYLQRSQLRAQAFVDVLWNLGMGFLLDTGQTAPTPNKVLDDLVSTAGFLLARGMPEAVARKGFHRVSSGDMDSSVCSTTGLHQSLMAASKTQWAGGAMVRLHAPSDRLRAAIPRNVSCLALPSLGQTHVSRLDSQSLTQVRMLHCSTCVRAHAAGDAACSAFASDAGSGCLERHPFDSLSGQAKGSLPSSTKKKAIAAGDNAG